jgi:2-oxo-4-hydroxy-4-carboxy--5-ureidoimidazoline (OHCU) decarboxylase
VIDLESGPAEDFVAATAPLFEGAPRFLARLSAARPFASADEMFERARAIAHAMPEDEQIELVDAHPRLGAPAGSVSALSFVEQGYDRESADTAAETERSRVAASLERLNATYEDRFGFRYCTFVAGRARPALLPEFEAAIDRRREEELHRALDAVIDIAIDRHAKLSREDAR